ncbi:MAG: 2Fe-2S iron-sulfur cluster binding domain-containing protein [Thiotrichaceae bacterium]|nr:2Fe-2S iron-sulfur cluster binding domain-containing protein [Thiotrichaceae bacterium]
MNSTESHNSLLAALCTTACSNHHIRLLQTGESYECSSAESLLHGLCKIGRKGIPKGCLNGGCGICKVAIRHGHVKKIGAMSRAHISEQEEAQGVLLACRIAPVDDVEIDVIGLMVSAILRGKPPQHLQK